MEAERVQKAEEGKEVDFHFLKADVLRDKQTIDEALQRLHKKHNTNKNKAQLPPKGIPQRRSSN